MDNQPLVQWTFLQYKKTSKATVAPPQCFLHSATQIGSKILYYGGCDYYGDAQSHLFIYDTVSYLWSSATDNATATMSYSGDGDVDQPGARYGHSATLVEMHPPKIMIYGGMVGGGTFEFDAPDTVETLDNGSGGMSRSFMSWRRKGKRHNTTNSDMYEETDDAVYYLTLSADKWKWSKPLIHGSKESKPLARAEHTAAKTGTNEVTIFGGWTDRPVNDMWTFNYVDNEWKITVSSGIQPRPRYRHTCEVVQSLQKFSMFILGGSDNSDDIAEDSRNLTIHELRLDTMQWSHPTITGYNPFPRSGHSSTVLGSKTIAVFGGKRNTNTFLNDMVLIDIDTFVGIKINAVEAHLPTPVANASLNTVGNKLFVFGGTDVKGNCFNDIRLLEVGYYLSNDDITVNEGASSDYSFKILIIGDAAVGKSALLTRFSDNAFLPHYSTTIGIDFNSRMIRVDKSICKLEIWDTAGQERFSTITANYYRGAQGALLVYDVTERTSFERVKSWYDRAIQLGGEDIEMVLVGNKTDLPITDRQISTEEGETLAQELGIPFVETSALNGSNVEAAFVTMTRNIKKSVDRRGLTGIKGKNLQQAGGVQLASKEKQSGISCGCT